MTESQLQSLEQEMMSKYIDAPAELEALIEDTTKKVARELYFSASQTSTVEFQDKVYVFKAKQKVMGNKRILFMVVINREYQDKINHGYKPYTVTAEIDNKFSYNENLEATVNTFFRHITGLTPEPEELND